MDSLLITQVEPEPFFEEEHALLVIVHHIWYPCSNHEVEQAQKQVYRFPEDVVRFTAVPLEPAVSLAIHAAHGLDHLFDNPHGRGEWLRIFSQNVTKVYVEEAAIPAEHEIVQVAVANAENVRHDAVPRAAFDEGFKNVGIKAHGRLRVGVVLGEKCSDVPELLNDV